MIGGLDHRNKGHVGVSRHGDGSHEVGRELRRQEDGGGTVGTTDDGDGTCLVRHKAERERNHVCAEYTELSSRTDKHKLRIGYQCGKVGHGTDSKEYQWRIPSGAHTIVKDIEHRPSS